MKAGWRTVPLEDVCKVVNGGTPKSNVATYWGGNVNWLTPKDMGQMTGRHIAETPRKITAKGLDDSSARLVPARSVIMSTRAPIGHLAINDAPMAFNQGCRGMIPGTNLDPVFLFHFLSANTDALNDLGTGTTFKELSATALRSFPIPLPPLDEQKRIVAVLDEAFEGLSRARANAEANLTDARELFAAAHKDALAAKETGWSKVTMADVTEIASTLVDPKLPDFSLLPHVGAGNMPTCSDRLVDVQTAAEEGLTSGKFLFDRRMVLYSKIRPYLRKAARPDFDGLCSADVYPLLPKEGVLDRDYLFYLLLGPDFTEYAIAGSARAGMPKVNREHLFKYAFELPDIERQRDLATLLDETLADANSLETNYTAKRDALDTLRQSLLQKAFSGELT